jgi:integration host factor subunit alpha
MTLTQSDIIKQISHRLDFSKSEAKNSIESLLEAMRSTLASGEHIIISGFGRFQVNDKAPRKGRNPATGEDMILDKRRTVTFKCSHMLRDQMNAL